MDMGKLDMSVQGERAKTFLGQLHEKVGKTLLFQSAANQGLVDVMQANGRHYQTIVEIGTLYGVGAIVLSYYAENVISIDVRDWPERKNVYKWLPAAVKEKISCVRVEDNDSKARLLRAMNFDFAFVDAGHSELQVAIDWGLVQKCGDVLFHDYPQSGSGCPGVGLVVDAIKGGTVTISRPFAHWRADACE